MRLAVVLLIAQSVLLGCAKVEVHPASWETTEREGIPFYLQRPYVVVQKSFPIEGEEGYLFGTIDRSTGTVRFQDMSDELSKRIGVEKEMSEFLPCGVRFSLLAYRGGKQDKLFSQTVSPEAVELAGNWMDV